MRADRRDAAVTHIVSIYEPLFRHVLFPLYEDVIKRRHTNRYLREYEKTQWLDEQALRELQLEKLNALLAHCWKNVPFLQRFWTNAGLGATPLRDLSEFAAYPVLTKQHITENYDDMRALGERRVVMTKTTGGSTGQPFRFEYSQENYARRTAVMWRGYRWCGTDLGKRTAYLWGTGGPQPGFAGTKERFYHRAYNRILLSAFTMSKNNLSDYVKEFARFRPEVMVGYVAPLVSLSRFMLATNTRVPTVRTVITGAEALTERERDVIASAFDAPVYNTYGCREFMLMACECEERNGLHVSADHLLVETLDDDDTPVYGASGDVCVTDFHNYAMPFVRYRNGDRATSSTRRCGCGRQLPLLDSIDGRILDVIISPDGRIVPGEFFVYAMLDFLTVDNYQFVQVAADRVEVRIVPRAGFGENERQQIAVKLAKFVGHELKFDILEVPEIQSTPSGKRRVAISQIR